MPEARPGRCVTPVLLALLGCDAARMLPDATSGDAGHGPATPDAGDGGLPAAPQPPPLPEEPRLPACLLEDTPAGCAALPVLEDWPCPEGWLAHPGFPDEHGGDDPPPGIEPFSICEPPPPPRDCPAGWMARLGSDQCVRIGDPCPEEDFPAVPDEVPGSRLHVLSGARAGDGTRDAPFGSVAAALAAAPAGALVLVGPGDYPPSLQVDQDVTLWGACAERVALGTGRRGAPDTAVIDVSDGARVELHNLRLAGGDFGLLAVGPMTKALLHGVWIDGAGTEGITADGASVRLEGCLVSDTQPGPEGFYGRGLFAVDGARVTVSGCTFERNGQAQVVAIGSGPHGPTTLDVTDTLLRDAAGIESGSFGWGLGVLDEATAVVERALVADNRMSGVVVVAEEGAGETALELRDVVVQGTRLSPDGLSGMGITVLSRDDTALRLEIHRVLLRDNAEVGLSVDGGDGEGAITLAASDLVVRATRTTEPGESGMGVWVQSGVRGTLERLLLDANHDTGLALGRTPPRGLVELEVSDLVVLETLGTPASPDTGHGLVALEATRGGVARALLFRNHGVGLLATGEGGGLDPVLTVADLVAAGPPCRPGTCMTYGVAASHAASLRLERGSVSVASMSGVLLLGVGGAAPTLHATDLRVSDTRGEPETLEGTGVAVADGGTLRLDRARIARTRGFGVWVGSHVAGQGVVPTSAALTDVLVTDTSRAGDGRNGVGLAVQDGGAVTIERVRLSGYVQAGVYVDGVLAGDRSTLTGTDLIVDGPGTDETGPHGNGLVAEEGARVALERSLLTGHPSAGILAYGSAGDLPTDLELVAVTVRDGVGRPDGHGGVGLAVERGARATLEGLRLERNREVGVLVIGDEGDPHPTLLEASRVAIVDTRFAPCADVPEGEEGSCLLDGANLGSGHGLAVVAHARASLEGFGISGSAGAGVIVARAGRITLRDGTVRGNAIGLNLLGAEASPDVLGERVYVFGNGIDASRSELPLPDPVQALGDLRRPDLLPKPSH